MKSQLNFYSRYHRNKNNTEIISLYNLISGLNLDVVISEQMSFTLPSPLHPIDHQNNLHRKSTKNQGLPDQRQERNSQHRRYNSCQHRDHTAPQPISYNTAMERQRFIQYGNIQNSSSESHHEQFISEGEQQKPRIHKIITLQEVKNSQEQKKSGAYSRSLEEMDCLKQTESVNSQSFDGNDGNKSDQCPNSPKIVRVTKNPSISNLKVSGQVMNKKYSSIDSLDIKKCSSHQSGQRGYKNEDSQINAEIGYSNEPEINNHNPLGDSSHHHRQQDIYSEQFIDDINKLIRNNQDDRKSTKEICAIPEYELEHSKSELLERVRGSDIQLEDLLHQATDYNEYPSTNKKTHITEREENEENNLQRQTIPFQEQPQQSNEEYLAQDIEEDEDEDGQIEEIQEIENDQMEAEQAPRKKYQKSGNPINNLQEVKETMSEEGENQFIQQSAILERLNFNQSTPQIQQRQRDDIENVNLEDHHMSSLAAPSINRKSFKKIIRNQNNSAAQSVNQNTPKSQNSPVNFKRTKKLNPRLVTSTIVPEGKGFHPIPQSQHPPQKVNFKKALMRGEQNRLKTESSKVSIKEASLQKSKNKREGQKQEESKKLLAAFFQQN